MVNLLQYYLHSFKLGFQFILRAKHIEFVDKYEEEIEEDPNYKAG